MPCSSGCGCVRRRVTMAPNHPPSAARPAWKAARHKARAWAAAGQRAPAHPCRPPPRGYGWSAALHRQIADTAANRRCWSRHLPPLSRPALPKPAGPASALLHDQPHCRAAAVRPPPRAHRPEACGPTPSPAGVKRSGPAPSSAPRRRCGNGHRDAHPPVSATALPGHRHRPATP